MLKMEDLDLDASIKLILVDLEHSALNDTTRGLSQIRLPYGGKAAYRIGTLHQQFYTMNQFKFKFAIHVEL